MTRYLLAVSSRLALASGCRHASVPTLPASHGHLSLALDKDLELPTKTPGAPNPFCTPVVVESEQAPSVFWWSVNELAWMYVQAGRYAEAAPLARRARDAAPRDPYVLEVLATTLAGLGHCHEAATAQRQAVEGLPDEWPAPERERFQSILREYTQRCATTVLEPPATSSPFSR